MLDIYQLNNGDRPKYKENHTVMEKRISLRGYQIKNGLPRN